MSTTFAALVAGPTGSAAAPPPQTQIVTLSTKPCIAVVDLRLCGASSVEEDSGLAWYCPRHRG